MLFDPRPTGAEIALAGERWQPPRISPARHRPANGFLTLPGFDAGVMAEGVMQWGASPDLTGLVTAHFESGALRSRDVPSFQSAGEAFAHGFFGFVKRARSDWMRLGFDFALCDVESVLVQIQHQYDAQDFEATSPLYLGIEVQDEQLWELGERAHQLRRAHPRLLQSVLALINRASARTVWIRTPDEFLGMFAQWFWEGDPNSTDEEAAPVLQDRFGDDEDEIAHYLPSSVRPELCPDDMDVGEWSKESNRFVLRPALGVNALRRVRRFQTGWIRRLCLELERLTLLLRRAGSRSLFDYAFRPETVYPACSIICEDGGHIGSLLDSHYEYFNSGGDGSTFLGFIPLAQTPDDIRRQYADWALGLSILNCVDRVIALVTR